LESLPEAEDVDGVAEWEDNRMAKKREREGKAKEKLDKKEKLWKARAESNANINKRVKELKNKGVSEQEISEERKKMMDEFNTEFPDWKKFYRYVKKKRQKRIK
jgi:hypothetical protein